MQLTLNLHAYQAMAVDYALDFVHGASPSFPAAARPGDRLLFSSPTGTGKSVMELALLERLPSFVLVTPRLEIVAGMLQKGGIDCRDWGTEKLADVAAQHRIVTPVRLRNRLAAGTFPFRPEGVILDEAHHGPAATYSEIKAYLNEPIWIGFTATPFRGTPQGTKAFLNAWGGAVEILTVADAAERGVLSVPRCEVWPLVDDDEVQVVSGEFQVRSVESAVTDLLDVVIERCRRFVMTGDPYYVDTLDGEFVTQDTEPARWDRPTLFSTPTTATCYDLARRLTAAGMPAEAVTQETPRAERNRIFAAAMDCRLAVVQIDVVSEGVDFPFRRLIDLRPTLSPVKWMQQVGRITRPTRDGESQPEYYCCNRNLERHGYLYGGAMPPAYISDAQKAFPKPSRRSLSRAFGLEQIGRFAPIELPLLDGCIGHVYLLSTVENFSKIEYAAVLHPATQDVLYAQRVSDVAPDGMTKWGRWQRIDTIPDVTGFQSAPTKALTEKQSAWWQRDAARYGLRPDVAAVNRRNFAALPILRDLNVRLKGSS